jgi:hypothetical protein
VKLAPSLSARYLIVSTHLDLGGTLGGFEELNLGNNARVQAATVTNRPADLAVTSVTTTPQNFSGEETVITFTVTNRGEAVWAGTQSWVDAIFISKDPVYIPQRGILLEYIEHSNEAGLAAGASYTVSVKTRLPAGTEWPFYIHVLTDAFFEDAEKGFLRNTELVQDTYRRTVFEANRYVHSIVSALNLG